MTKPTDKKTQGGATPADAPSETTPEFSHVIDLDDVPRLGRRFHLCADENTCARVAERLSLPAIAELDAIFHVTVTTKRIEIKGDIGATLTRICVASLDEMVERIDESVDAVFYRQGDQQPASEFSPFDGVHEDVNFDLGEFFVQHVSLAMADYPRKPDGPSLLNEYGKTSEASPFAELAQLTGVIDKKHDT